MVAVVGDQVTRRGIRVVFAKVFVGLGDLGRGQTDRGLGNNVLVCPGQSIAVKALVRA